MDEVLADRAKEDSKSEKENRVSIMKKAPSFMMSKHRSMSRQPSFFKKMFSMRNMDKVFVDGDEEGSENSQEDQNAEENAPTGTVNEGENSEFEGEDHEEHEDTPKRVIAEPVEMDSKYAYVDPPMPKMGNPVDMDLLINRNKKAEYGLQKLMDMVLRDVDESLKDTKVIPVASSFDRIHVSEEQSQYIGKVRTTKDIEKRVKTNVQHIQKALNYRKSALIMMNSNYSHQLVRLIEPIYAQEARTITMRAGDLGAPKHHHHHEHGAHTAHHK